MKESAILLMEIATLANGKTICTMVRVLLTMQMDQVTKVDTLRILDKAEEGIKIKMV